MPPISQLLFNLPMATGKESRSPSNSTFLRVAVGSTNPSKIRAVEQALSQASAGRHDVTLELDGFSVASGVPDQPFGDEETRQGAKNRAEVAYFAYRKKHGKYPHIAVGIEGGLEWVTHGEEKALYCMAWMAIFGRREASTVEMFASNATENYYGDRKPIFGLAKTANFQLPPAIEALIQQGKELGDADDQVFGRTKSKHGSGTVGILTDGIIDRSSYYEHAILLALVPWIRPDVYHQGSR